jgi:hypothetical protein
MNTGQGFGSGWHTFKNGFWNATRYLLIAGMFAFLLTMIILLNEVMNFHNGIVQQVTEPYARRVVLMLDKMNRYPEAYPEEPALPVAELAVELDSVRQALRELDRFAEIRPSPDEVLARLPDQEAPTGPDESEDESAPEEVSLKDRSAALQIRLDSLRDML